MNPGDEQSFQQLTGVISKTTGLSLQSFKDRCLRRRIAVRMRAHGLHTYDEYRALLEGSPEEYGRLKDALTINVTRFYRNAETWQALAGEVLEQMVAKQSGRLSVWSAGCASGEEPYTLAMVLADILQQAGRPSWLTRVSIDATDIDRASLEKASRGWFPAAAFEEAPEHFAVRYCEPADGGYQVRQSLRDQVNVSQLDLMQDEPKRRDYDVILCRNVVIYFDRPMQDRLFSRFADALRPEGVLVLGKVETMLGPAAARFKLINIRERIYRRAA